MTDLKDRVALVTGGGMGIGRASAVALARAGAAVAVVDVDEAAARDSAGAIEAAGGQAIAVTADVTEWAQVEAAVEAARARFGPADILVNNAARAIPGAVDAIDEATWNTVMSTNLTSAWRFMRLVVPDMKAAGRGAIVNMSSVQGLTGFEGWAAYAAAKGGINALTRQTARDLAPFGIRVNAVAPGTIMTPLNERVFREAANPDALVRRWSEMHPIGRFGEAEEVAEAVVFLASDRASFITGDILRVDGGLMVKGD